MKWACIFFPQFALDGVLRNCPDPDEPLVLLHGPIQRRIIKAANAAALALGLRPEMTYTAAQAICQQFATVEYDEAALRRQHELLAAWAYGFSSQVSLHFADALVLDVESSLPLFGPWPRFEARLRQELTALGFGHQITLAPNPVAARVLANAGDSLAVRDNAGLASAMRTLPVALLGFKPEIVQALSRMGLRQLSQVLALPWSFSASDHLQAADQAQLRGRVDASPAIPSASPDLGPGHLPGRAGHGRPALHPAP